MAPGPANDATAHVQQPVAQRLGLGPGHLTVEAAHPQPGQQVGSGQHQLQPRPVGGEGHERHAVEPGVAQSLDAFRRRWQELTTDAVLRLVEHPIHDQAGPVPWPGVGPDPSEWCPRDDALSDGPGGLWPVGGPLVPTRQRSVIGPSAPGAAASPADCLPVTTRPVLPDKETGLGESWVLGYRLSSSKCGSRSTNSSATARSPPEAWPQTVSWSPTPAWPAPTRCSPIGLHTVRRILPHGICQDAGICANWSSCRADRKLASGGADGIRSWITQRAERRPRTGRGGVYHPVRKGAHTRGGRPSC